MPTLWGAGTVALVSPEFENENPTWRTRLLTIDDVVGIARVQQSAYEPRYHESVESFEAKLRAGEGTCFGIDDLKGDLAAYLVALACHPGFVMPLDSAPREVVPLAVASCLYVHDVAVAAAHRGYRLGDLLWEEVRSLAGRHGIGQVELVSVQNSTAWWEAKGFTVSGEAEGGYGAEAVRMVAPITF